MFCVECGNEGETFDGLCAECYLSKREFVRLPQMVDIPVCSECFGVRLRKKWLDALDLEDAVRIFIEDAVWIDDNAKDIEVRFELTKEDPRNYNADVVVNFRVHTIDAHKQSSVKIRLKKETCQRCGRRAGHYYEAIIQIRGAGKGTRRSLIDDARYAVLNRVEHIGRKNRDVFISKDEDTHGGYDLYMSSSSAAKMIVRELAQDFGAETKTSVSIAGSRDGADLKRVTYLVRFPEYEVGDILITKDSAFLLKSINENTLSLMDLRDWRESSLSVNRMPEFEVLKAVENVQEATVVAPGENELQIIDPDTMKAVEILRPPDMRVEGDTVKVVRTKFGILPLP